MWTSGCLAGSETAFTVTEWLLWPLSLQFYRFDLPIKIFFYFILLLLNEKASGTKSIILNFLNNTVSVCCAGFIWNHSFCCCACVCVMGRVCKYSRLMGGAFFVCFMSFSMCRKEEAAGSLADSIVYVSFKPLKQMKLTTTCKTKH